MNHDEYFQKNKHKQSCHPMQYMIVSCHYWKFKYFKNNLEVGGQEKFIYMMIS